MWSDLVITSWKAIALKHSTPADEVLKWHLAIRQARWNWWHCNDQGLAKQMPAEPVVMWRHDLSVDSLNKVAASGDRSVTFLKSKISFWVFRRRALPDIEMNNTHRFNIPDGGILHDSWKFLQTDCGAEEHAFRFRRVRIFPTRHQRRSAPAILLYIFCI